MPPRHYCFIGSYYKVIIHFETLSKKILMLTRQCLEYIFFLNNYFYSFLPIGSKSRRELFTFNSIQLDDSKCCSMGSSREGSNPDNGNFMLIQHFNFSFSCSIQVLNKLSQDLLQMVSLPDVRMCNLFAVATCPPLF